MPRYHIWTSGCQMNQAESARLAADLEKRGYEPAADAAAADLIILNSCVVRQSAEDRARHKLAALGKLPNRRPRPELALTGCLVDLNTDELKREFPRIDHFFPAGATPPWANGDWSPELKSSPPFAYVPIMQGCDNYCAYCIVPYRRGPERSRPPAEVVTEVAALVNQGVREVILLGQNVDSYGHDLPGKPELASLLGELNAVAGLKRLRFLTNHPKDMIPALIDAVAGLDKVCEQICLPVQAGSDAVLQAMRRGYTVAHYRELVARIRRRLPEAALSTDVIVGFPGETAAQFRETRDLLADLRFDVVHAAAYSPRPGTYAARHLKDDVPPEEKRARLAEIETLQEGIAAEINHRLLGQRLEVLTAGRKKGKCYGRTRSDKLVFFPVADCRQGQAVNVIITHTSPWSLQGEVTTIQND